MRSALRFTAAFVLALALAACSKVTPENYARIQDGMSEAEVTAILGKPDQTSAGAILGMRGSSNTWVGSEYSITLQFVNGKVRVRSLTRKGG